MFLCLTIIAVPESPKWLVSKGRFTEAKESLERVARFNGQHVTKDDFVLENEDSVPDGDQSSNASQRLDPNQQPDESRNKYNITERQFSINLLVMMGMYVVGTFSFWLIDFQLEYLGNSLYLNFYLGGMVLILSAQTTISLY